MAEFTHLHLHSHFSLLDGACEPEKLVSRVKELGMTSVAMTDHGNIFGAMHFYNAAKSSGIRPIIGCELYICKKDDHRAAPEGDKHNHLLVLAESDEGYRNLMKITSEASLHGMYYKPRVSKKFLAAHSKGLIGLSGCLAGQVCEELMEGHFEKAKAAAGEYSEIFGKNNFFLEIQDQGLPEEHRIHKDLFKLESDLGIPMVATNDSHYLCEGDAHAHDVLICVQTGKSVHDTNRLKFHGEFLIVWDFIRYAKENNIPVGPGRGSAAGSLVSYAMGITDIDPLQNELLFERFLNPERVSMPDIDIDFCMNRRGEVINYVTQKYGRDNVAQIITFGTMAAKAAIKDVGRAMDIPYADVDRIAKMVPTQLNITLEQAIEDSPQLREAMEKDGQIRELMATARKLEGLVRNSGVHAAGVVIAPRPLADLVPLQRPKNGETVTAFDMVAIEKMGLLKMEFLGLTTLTILVDKLKLIAQTRSENITPAGIV